MNVTARPSRSLPPAAPLPPLLDTAALHALLEDAAGGIRPVRLLDVRWALDGSKGHGTYLTGHLPDAVYLDLDTELAAPARPEAGTPCPSPRTSRPRCAGPGSARTP